VDVAPLLLELYGRIPPLARSVVEGLDAATLARSPGSEANTIGWLIWHLSRVEDSHVAELLEADQLWATGDWAGRCGLAPDPSNTGYGHTPEEVAAVRPDGPEVLLDYLEATHARTCSYLEGLEPGELDRVVDRNWDPPVTLGVRLVSIADDCLQHIGQAAYVRGLLERS
jgi:hypothetical protein